MDSPSLPSLRQKVNYIALHKQYYSSLVALPRGLLL